MNLKLAIALFFAINIFQINAQEREVIITGRVVDSLLNEPLFSVDVLLKDKFYGTITNADGNFILRISDNRKQDTLQFNYLGFKTKEIQIKLNRDEIDLGTVKLQEEFESLDAVIVTSSLEGQQKALNQQRNADNIKNIVSADLIGRFPDLNVAEALQRVPGININRDKGEGSEVSIRGTPANFTTIQINGEQIPSVQQDGQRNESLDLIPADQLATMEVTKAPTADMDGDAIGGVVNLRTPTAKKNKLGLKAESALGFNDISGGLNGIGKLKLDKRFFENDDVTEGKLGIMASASYFSTDNSEDRIDADWQGIPRPVQSLGTDELVLANYQFRKTENQRERIGATFTADYKFNDKNSIVFNYMFNRREDNDLRNRFRIDTDRSGTEFPSLDTILNARVRRDINFFDEIKTNNSFNLQGYHTLKNWQIDWGAYYTISNRTFSSDRGDFSRDEIDLVVNSPKGIYEQIPEFATLNPDTDLFNPLLYNDFRRYEEDAETTDATNMVGRVDFTNFFKLFDKYDSYIKFGSKVRMQTNSKFRDNVVFAINDPNNVLRANEAFLRVIGTTEPDDFLYDDVRFGPTVDRNRFRNYISDNRAFFQTADNAWDSRRLSLSDTYDAFEDIYAAYIMGRFQIDKLMILAGVRYEYNDVGYDAFEVIRQGTNVEGTPISGGNDYGFILPNIHLKYSINRFTALRFSSVFNYARPNFVDLVPFVNFDADAVRLSLGNPELQPASAFNLDFMYETYFKNVGVLSVGAFYKSIDDFQFSRIDPSLADEFPGYPNTQGFEFRQEQNGENAQVAGLEVNFVRSLDFLPEFFKNFSINANYTYAFSDAFTQDRDGISLPGQAEHTANAALAFDYKKFTTRLSANYNGEFLSSIASQSQDDIIQKDRLQLDLNASYDFDKNWRIYTEVVNMTNAPAIRYQGDSSRISRIAYFGWWSRIGLSYRF